MPQDQGVFIIENADRDPITSKDHNYVKTAHFIQHKPLYLTLLRGIDIE